MIEAVESTCIVSEETTGEVNAEEAGTGVCKIVGSDDADEGESKGAWVATLGVVAVRVLVVVAAAGEGVGTGVLNFVVVLVVVVLAEVVVVVVLAAVGAGVGAGVATRQTKASPFTKRGSSRVIVAYRNSPAAPVRRYRTEVGVAVSSEMRNSKCRSSAPFVTKNAGAVVVSSRRNFVLNRPAAVLFALVNNANLTSKSSPPRVTTISQRPPNGIVEGLVQQPAMSLVEITATHTSTSNTRVRASIALKLWEMQVSLGNRHRFPNQVSSS